MFRSLPRAGEGGGRLDVVLAPTSQRPLRSGGGQRRKRGRRVSAARGVCPHVAAHRSERWYYVAWSCGTRPAPRNEGRAEWSASNARTKDRLNGSRAKPGIHRRVGGRCQDPGGMAGRGRGAWVGGGDVRLGGVGHVFGLDPAAGQRVQRLASRKQRLQGPGPPHLSGMTGCGYGRGP